MTMFQINNAIDAALNTKKVLRVAFYIRVSTSEQVSKENSLPAQKIALDEWCAKNNAVCVGVYADEGKTAAKEIRKRKEIHRMLADIRDGLIDLVIFTRFDRFTRNPEEYFKMMETFNAAGVQWKAIMQQELDLNTDMGQTLILFYLGMGKQEISNISERIKATVAVRIQKGAPTTGAHCLPLGFTIGKDDRDNKIVIHDPETEPIVWEYIKHYELHHSRKAAMVHCNDLFGVNHNYHSYNKMMKNTLMYGHYKGVDNYCEPYVTKERFEHWASMNEKNIRVRNQERTTYIFSQLCVCGVCGNKMVGHTVKNRQNTDFYYMRCNKAKQHAQCSHTSLCSEAKLEKYLLENIKHQIEQYIHTEELRAAEPVKRPKVDVVAKLQKEIDRLNYQFRKERISMEQYDADYEELAKKMSEALARQEKEKNPQPKDLAPLRKFLEMDIDSIYIKFTREEKRGFWRSILDNIVLYPDKTYEVNFIK